MRVSVCRLLDLVEPPPTKQPPTHASTIPSYLHPPNQKPGEGWKALGEAQAKAGQAFVVLTGKEVRESNLCITFMYVYVFVAIVVRTHVEQTFTYNPNKTQVGVGGNLPMPPPPPSGGSKGGGKKRKG